MDGIISYYLCFQPLLEKLQIKYVVSWIKRYKLNKVLLHSTGHYIQYLLINYNGKESEKEYIFGWTKSLYGFFCKMLWKNPNELFGQPNI